MGKSPFFPSNQRFYLSLDFTEIRHDRVSQYIVQQCTVEKQEILSH